MSRKKTHEEFLAELKEKSPNIIVLGEYKSAITPIECECERCGHIWPPTPNSLLSGHGCPICDGGINKGNAAFLEELHRVNPNIKPLETYQNNKTPILCECKQCGHIWPAKPKNLLKNKYSCPKCGPEQRGVTQRKTNLDFINELAELHPNIEPLDEYTTSSKRIKCKCKKCGHIWHPTPNNLLSKGSGCPNCDHYSTSIIEQIIYKSFSIVLGKSAVFARERKTIGKELDVYVPSMKLAIEFGAWFWHKDKLKNDNEKQRLCKEKDIHLITIFEYCTDAIEDQLIGDYRLFKKKLSNENEYHSTKEIIKGIFFENDLPFSSVDASWETIVEEAKKAAQKRDEETFKKMLKSKHPNIKLIGKYSQSDARVRVRCEKCGKEWTPYASSLLSGHGCQHCEAIKNGRKRRMTNEEFLIKLAKIDASIKPLEPYVKSDVKILCKCLNCGNEWRAKPANLLSRKSKCSNCSREKYYTPVRCIETGECYSSVSEAHRKTGIYNIHGCAKGKQKTAGGFHWEFVKK